MVGYCKFCTFSLMKKSLPAPVIFIVITAIMAGIIRGQNTGPKAISLAPNPLNNLFGINCYEWDILQNPNNLNDVSRPYEPKMKLIDGFSGIRHYLDWGKIEPTRGNYTFNPANNGGLNYDALYQRCKTDGLMVLTCLKTCPQWLVNTYPQNEQDNENVPAPYGLDRRLPATYVLQAKAAFQFAARYGNNKHIDPKLLSVDTRPRWTNDPPNVVKTGLGLVHYIECDNERDKWWKGRKAQQTAEEYAANLSAFYDGDKGRLGKNVGVKTADPAMQVVMGGLAKADVKYVADIINWCKKHRGYKPDGRVDVCFDVINYHYYPNDSEQHFNKQATRGIAPELSDAANIADGFVALAQKTLKNPQVWVTETGYDLHPKSPQRAIPIGSKSAQITQADWLLRSALLYNRHGIKRLFYYQLFEDNNTAQAYGTSGLADAKTLQRRPAADYLLQTAKLMGNYNYTQTLSTQPWVDEYTLGAKKMFILTLGDEQGRTLNYTLNLGTAKTAVIHTLKVGAYAMDSRNIKTVNGKVTVAVSETPVFVEEF